MSRSQSTDRTVLTNVLNRCLELLPFLRLPGYFPTPPWDLIDIRPAEAPVVPHPALAARRGSAVSPTQPRHRRGHVAHHRAHAARPSSSHSG